MKVQQIQQNNYQKEQKQSPKFKGFSSQFLRYLATNQAVGANGVDVAFMVLPRTGTDLIKRGPAAGLETGRREASGTANHTFVGLYGILSGIVAATLMGMKKNFGTKVNDIFTSPETLNILAENKAQQIKDGKSQLEYLKSTLSSVKAFNPTSAKTDGEGFVKLPEKTINEVAELINKNLDKKISFNVWENKKTADGLRVAINKMVEATGADSKLIIESADKKIKSETNLKTLLEDIYKVSNSFNEEKVVEAFKEQVSKNKGINENLYVQKLSKFMKSRSVAGFAIATAIGMSIQPLNVYLTKKKTGSDGFVGVEGRSKDNSTGFKVLKGVSAAGFFGLVLTTLKTGIKGFMSKMSFTGFWPTISQLKGIYGLTIISRILATRDKDELRESLTKDTLGFLSWLVLGDFVNKLTAATLDKPEHTVLNSVEKEAKGFKAKAKRLFNASLKTRDEILIESLAKEGIETIKKTENGSVAKTFKELMQDLDKLPEEARKIAKKRLSTLNKAQLVGYLFSGLVLGLGIPNLNIYITNTLDKKKKARQQQELATAKA